MRSPLPLHISVPALGLRLLLPPPGGVHHGFHPVQLHQVVADGRVFGVFRLVLLLQLAVFHSPLGKGQLALQGEAVFQIAAGHVKLPQFPLQGVPGERSGCRFWFSDPPN